MIWKRESSDPVAVIKEAQIATPKLQYDKHDSDSVCKQTYTVAIKNKYDSLLLTRQRLKEKH